jgi:hypothetical protein
LTESSLVAEYECGNVHNYHLGGHPSPGGSDTVHILPPTQSSSTIFSSCSLDRSTILRLVEPQNYGHSDSQDAGTNTTFGEDYEGLIAVSHDKPLVMHVLDCKSWESSPLALPSLDISEGFLLDSTSLINMLQLLSLKKKGTNMTSAVACICGL